MSKLTYVLKIAKDRWIRPYDDIILRFNTKAENDNPLVWRVYVNGVEHLASGFEVHGYMYDQISYEAEVKKFNVGCKGRVRWDGTKAVIITAKKDPDTAF
jgi:hypothetical protein